MSDQIGSMQVVVDAETTGYDAKMAKVAATADKTARAQTNSAKEASKAQVVAAKLSGDAVQEEAVKVVTSLAEMKVARSDYLTIQRAIRSGELEGVEATNKAAQALTRLSAAKLTVAEASRVQQMATLSAVGAMKVEEAAGHAISDRMAASAVVRGLETGNVGIRAVENTLTRFVGSGVLQTAFNVISPIAFAAAVFKGVDALYEMEQKGKKAGAELALAWGEMRTKLDADNDELALTNSLLNDQYLKITRQPNNGMETALLKGVVAADKLKESFAAALRGLNALLKEHDVSGLEGILSGMNPTTGKRGSTAEIGEYGETIQKKLDLEEQGYVAELKAAGANQAAREAADKAHYARVAEIAAEGARHMRDRESQERKKSDDLTAAEAMADQVNGGSFHPAHDPTQVLAGFQNAAEAFDRLQRHSELVGLNFTGNEKVEGAKGARQGDEAAKKAAELRLKQAEGELAAMGLIQSRTLVQDFEFWTNKLSIFAKGSEQYMQVQEKMAALAKEGAAKAHELIAKQKAEDKRDDSGDAAIDLRGDPMAKWNEEKRKRQQEAIDQMDTFNLRYAALNEKLGEFGISEDAGKNISRLAAALQMANIHAQSFRTEMAILQSQLATAERTSGSGLTDSETEAASKRAAELRVKIAELQGSRNMQVQQDANATNLPAMSSPLVGVTDALNDLARSAQDAAKVMNEWFSSALASTNAGIIKELTEKHRKGQPSIWGGIGHDIATSGAGSLLKMGEGKLLQAFGLGGKKDIQKVYVTNLPSITGGPSSAAASIVGGGFGSSGGGGMGSFLSAIAQGASVGGFANGTDFAPGGLSWVGERGPELMNVPRGASITPNHELSSLGGDTHHHYYDIDARGAHDPAAVEAAVQRGIARAAPHIVGASVKAQRSYQARRPSSSR